MSASRRAVRRTTPTSSSPRCARRSAGTWSLPTQGHEMSTVVKAPRPQVREDVRPQDHVIVLFGATGDLSRRKLLPGLFHLAEAGLLPEGYRVVGASIEELGEDEFRAFAKQAVDEFGRLPTDDRSWDAFGERVNYIGGDYGPGSTEGLSGAVARAEADLD